MRYFELHLKFSFFSTSVNLVCKLSFFWKRFPQNVLLSAKPCILRLLKWIFFSFWIRLNNSCWLLFRQHWFWTPNINSFVVILLFVKEALFARTYSFFTGAGFWNMLFIVVSNIPKEIERTSIKYFLIHGWKFYWKTFYNLNNFL